jgi:hypothetical protein
VELKSIGNVTIKLINLLDTEKFRNLKVGNMVKYRGRIIYLDLPMFEEDSIRLSLSDVTY